MKIALALLLLAASSSFGAMFTYDIAVDTSGLSSMAGTIDFQLNPGDLTSDLASAAVSSFVISGPGSLTGAPQYFGDAMGSLPGSLIIANTFNDNEALQALTFGTGLSFRLTLSEILTGTALTGSVFNFYVFESDGFTPLLTVDPNGVLASIALDAAGRATASTTAAAASVTSTVPEPASVLMLCAGLCGLAGLRRRLAA